MIGAAVVEALESFVPRENILLQERMAGHTTFRIGGCADCFVQLENETQLKGIQRYLGLAEIPYFVLGRRKESTASYPVCIHASRPKEER